MLGGITAYHGATKDICIPYGLVPLLEDIVTFYSTHVTSVLLYDRQ